MVSGITRKKVNTHVLQHLTATQFLLCLRLLHAVPHGDELSVKIFQTSPDRLCNRLLDMPLHHSRRNRLDRFINHIVLRIANAKLQRIHLDMHVLDFEDGAAIFVGRNKMDSHRHSLSTEDDIRYARVPQFGEPSLLAEIQGNVSHVRLDLCECDCELVMPFILNGIMWAKLEKVECLHRYNVGEQVAPLKSKILDDKVKRIIGVFDSWNGQISNLECQPFSLLSQQLNNVVPVAPSWAK